MKVSSTETEKVLRLLEATPRHIAALSQRVHIGELHFKLTRTPGRQTISWLISAPMPTSGKSIMTVARLTRRCSRHRYVARLRSDVRWRSGSARFWTVSLGRQAS
jgi:hypothetical protein